MQRDWELVRQILLKTEELSTTTSVLPAGACEGYASEVVSYHMKIMGAAGLIRVQCREAINGPLLCSSLSLTWEGHEFLDKIRSHTAWNKVKGVVRDKGLDLSFDVIKLAAKAAIEGLFS